jgi:hypothetical protein
LFEKLLGLPAHPLLVHAAVIFVPLLVVGALAYALVPRWRSRIGWVVALLAVIGPISATLAKLSGDAFHNRLVRRGASGQLVDMIIQHRGYGTTTLWCAVPLGVVVLIFLYLTSQRGPLARVGRLAAGEPRPGTSALLLHGVLIVVTVGLALASAFYVYKTGDSGARMSWGSS